MSVAPMLYEVTETPALAAVLKDLLTQEGWGAEELARRSGLAAKTVSRLLNGRTTEPKRATVAALAAALNVDESALVGPRPERQQTQLDRIEGMLRELLQAVEPASGEGARDAGAGLREFADWTQRELDRDREHPEEPDASEGSGR
jgi:transcriptional regulator with XRE-family HTH domain